MHRDVKPANVLVDEDGHAYLTDFGVTKQLGGDTTETGQLVGTLDYMAPEQIRGEDVDGRADGYALACVLYECLAGSPPFRATEAETLWAHMQEPPPPLPGRPALDPVMVKALAKYPGDRYGTLRRADRRRPPRRSRTRSSSPQLLRRRHAVLAAGVPALAATAVAIALASATAALRTAGTVPLGRRARRHRAPTGRHRLLHRRRHAAEQPRGRRGRVWLLNTADERSRASTRETGEVIRSSSPPTGPPTLRREPVRFGNLIGEGLDVTGPRVSRVDPETGTDDGHGEAPRGGDENTAAFQRGLPGIAFGEGAVWAINPDEHRLPA